MAHRILVRVGPPFIQVLVQKSVTAITNLAGRLSRPMLRKLSTIRKRNRGRPWADQFNPFLTEAEEFQRGSHGDVDRDSRKHGLAE
jgi:hypothetical protein